MDAEDVGAIVQSLATFEAFQLGTTTISLPNVNWDDISTLPAWLPIAFLLRWRTP
jgi:hypothetical protein